MIEGIDAKIIGFFFSLKIIYFLKISYMNPIFT